MIITELLDSIASLNRPNGEIWFRGQADVSWPLTPRLLRCAAGLMHERNILTRFRSRSMGMISNHPADDDPARWMFLMQHHGLPTRLLDWTESALAALYFAASSHQDTDGAVYILLPMDLNRDQSAQPVLFSPRTADTHQMLLASFKGTDMPAKILAMLAYASNERISRQQGHFTVHGSSDDLRSVVSTPSLTTVTIPTASKVKIRKQLAYFGVTRASLFHDLDSLAADLREQHGII